MYNHNSQPTEDEVLTYKAKHGNGVFIKKSTGYIIVLIFIAVIAGVACLFYFAPDRTCEDTGEDTDEVYPPVPELPESPDRGEFEGRLPDTLEPLNYWLKLKVYLDEEDAERQFQYDGLVNITIVCTKATNIIKVHHRLLNIDTDSVSVKTALNNDPVSIKDVSFSEEEYEFLIIETEDELQVNEHYLLQIDFIGFLNHSDYKGFYRSYYEVETDGETETRWLALTQFQSTDARRAFPCFDEPNFKATFDVILVHRPSRTAVSNMDDIATVIIEDGNWVETHFDTSVRMSVYLVAFLISDFEYMEMNTTHGVLMRVWARSDYIDAANYSMYTGSELLTIFEDNLDMPYPLKKVDMAAVPHFSAGAMENWGLVLYRESVMLYDPTIHSPERRVIVAVYIAHELGHMWFGNLVTMDWWDHLWLNEGFATFVEYTGVHIVEPEWRLWDMMLKYAMGYALAADSNSATSNPIIRETGWIEEINSMFDTISYSKGGCIIRQFLAFMDPSVLMAGIRNYLKIYQYSNTVSDDLWQVLTEADLGHGNYNIKLIMDTWTLQPGYPIVTVNRSSPEVAVLSQERFFSDPNDNHSDRWPHLGYTWYIPTTYTTMGNVQEGMMNPEKLWMNRGPADIDLSNVDEEDWIFVNINKTGFYRVNYDDDNWNKLAEQLRDDHEVITSQSRSSLVDDAFRVSETFHTDHVNALKLTEYLHEEKEYMPWYLIAQVLPFTDKMLLRTAEFGMHENYWRYQVSPSYEFYGWNFKDSQDIDYWHRELAIDLACMYNYNSCVDNSTNMFADWMQDTENNPIPEEVRSAVYCTAVRHGGPVEWEFVYQQAEQETDNSQLWKLQSALGCTRDTWLLQRYMEDYHSKSNAPTAIANCREKSSQGFSTAWMFTLSQFESLQERYNTTAYYVVWDFAPWMNTDYDLEQLLAFGRHHSDMPEFAASGFYTAVEKVETNVKWMKRNQDSVRQWLSQITDKIGMH